MNRWDSLPRRLGLVCCLATAIVSTRALCLPPPLPSIDHGKPARVERIVIQTDLWVLIPDAPFKSTFIIARHGQRFDLQGMAYDGRDAHLYSESVSSRQ